MAAGITHLFVLCQLHRLRKRQDFALVYQRGKSFYGVNLFVRVRLTRSEPAAPLSPARFGISVSQKVSKRAVQRNRIKRQLRAACRQLLPRTLPGWDVIIVVRHQGTADPKRSDPKRPNPQPLQCGYQKFLQELEQLLVEAKVIHGH
jgi:ribonuclease P protein component